jgi:SAM-dependent methyltransferase
MAGREHWDLVYGRKAPDQVSWYQPHLDRSLEILRSIHLPVDASIIDVGGGASTFVDDVLDLGYTDITVLDLSPSAIQASKRRLGPRAGAVHWIQGDITAIELEAERYDFWHDRAVFHFLVDDRERHSYVAAVRKSLKSKGHIVVATFGPAGPNQCSGLDVRRYDANALHAEFGRDFSKVTSFAETHVTPSGARQEYVYCYCRGPEHRIG